MMFYCVQMYFVHSSTEGQLCCSFLLAIIHNSAMTCVSCGRNVFASVSILQKGKESLHSSSLLLNHHLLSFYPLYRMLFPRQSVACTVLSFKSMLTILPTVRPTLPTLFQTVSTLLCLHFYSFKSLFSPQHSSQSKAQFVIYLVLVAHKRVSGVQRETDINSCTGQASA